jgi:hypothetical protein
MDAYTIAVAGSPRHDGEKPWWYVVTATDMPDAERRALAIHAADTGDDDLIVIPEQSFPGIPDNPPDLMGHAWNDYRDDSSIPQHTLWVCVTVVEHGSHVSEMELRITVPVTTNTTGTVREWLEAHRADWSTDPAAAIRSIDSFETI